MLLQVDLSHHYEGLGAGSASNITGYATKVHALAYVTSFQQVSNAAAAAAAAAATCTCMLSPSA
jgi:hypothetical protein